MMMILICIIATSYSSDLWVFPERHESVHEGAASAAAGWAVQYEGPDTPLQGAQAVQHVLLWGGRIN